MKTRALTVLEVGALATIQDRGRIGYAHLGVPRAGAADPISAAAANRLVGNGPDAATVELLLGGARIAAGEAMTIAVTGAECAITVDGRPAAFGQALSLHPGAEVRIGVPQRGLRVYLAVSGGVHVPEVLGSRSTDTLAWIGPPPVRAGQVLPVGPALGRPRAGTVEPVAISTAGVAGSAPGAVSGPIARIRYVVGPRADWVADLPQGDYVVGADSNRIGVRLRGGAVERARSGELASEPIVLGAIQVPGSGQPVVFLADHPTTGGYPIIGVVLPTDLTICAQVRPGDVLQLSPLTVRSDHSGSTGPPGSS